MGRKGRSIGDPLSPGMAFFVSRCSRTALPLRKSQCSAYAERACSVTPHRGGLDWVRERAAIEKPKPDSFPLVRQLERQEGLEAAIQPLLTTAQDSGSFQRTATTTPRGGTNRRIIIERTSGPNKHASIAARAHVFNIATKSH